MHWPALANSRLSIKEGDAIALPHPSAQLCYSCVCVCERGGGHMSEGRQQLSAGVRGAARALRLNQGRCKSRCKSCHIAQEERCFHGVVLVN